MVLWGKTLYAYVAHDNTELGEFYSTASQENKTVHCPISLMTITLIIKRTASRDCSWFQWSVLGKTENSLCPRFFKYYFHDFHDLNCRNRGNSGKCPQFMHPCVFIPKVWSYCWQWISHKAHIVSCNFIKVFSCLQHRPTVCPCYFTYIFVLLSLTSKESKNRLHFHMFPGN